MCSPRLKLCGECIEQPIRFVKSFRLVKVGVRLKLDHVKPN